MCVVYIRTRRCRLKDLSCRRINLAASSNDVDEFAGVTGRLARAGGLLEAIALRRRGH